MRHLNISTRCCANQVLILLDPAGGHKRDLGENLRPCPAGGRVAPARPGLYETVPMDPSPRPESEQTALYSALESDTLAAANAPPLPWQRGGGYVMN